MRNYKLLSALLFSSALVFTACGGGGGDDDGGGSPTGSAPVVLDNTLTVAGDSSKDLQITASDADGDTLTYSIVTQPNSGIADINSSTGMLTYESAQKGVFTIEIGVTDGTNPVTATVTATVENSAPTVNEATIAMPTVENPTFQVSASDYDGDEIFYSITTLPSNLGADINSSGAITFSNFGDYSTEFLIVEVTDGNKTASARITILPPVGDITGGGVFTSQFYRVRNPDTGNYQIVHYDSITGNQRMVKEDVILGDRVFVMSGTKEGDKTVYGKREYAFFQDPNANSETRTAEDPRSGTYEYIFYADHILKRFDAADTSAESIIFEGASLKQEIQALGLSVIGSTNTLFLNEVDTTNSYIELNAYNELADILQNENPEDKRHAPIVVRLSDSAHTLGRAISVIENNTTGLTDGVLVSYVSPHIKGSYPTAPNERKRLQLCDTALNCSDVTGADGSFFFLSENSTHIYMTKEGSNKISAYNKADNSIGEVTGVTFPAVYDADHHDISLTTNKPSHAGFFPAFITLTNARATLFEGADAYVAINYDLDSKNPVGPGPYDRFGWLAMAFKNAMVLKLTGTTGIKVYDNGDGIDHMDNPADNNVNYHISLTAVKDGNLFLEAAKYNGDPTNCRSNKNCVTLKQAWLHTADQNATKTDFDNIVTDSDYAYMMARRVPPVAVGDSLFVVQTDDSNRPNIYNVYKMPLNDATLETNSTGVIHTLGRMYFERTAYRSTGVFEGAVITWDGGTGEVRDVTNDVTIGSDNDIFEDPASIPFSVMAKSSTNNTAGYGGLFGLRMSLNHAGEEVYLVSGETGAADSLKKVNRINGFWIVD